VFKEGSTLLDVLIELFKPFGWGTEDAFIVENETNTLAKAGIRGTPRTKGGKKKGPRPLKRFVLHQLHPYPREGVFQFASRIAQRHGLMLWMTASGRQLVVSNPNFDIDPFYRLIRNATGTTNVLDGSVKIDIKDQPTCIVADAASGGGEFGRGRIKVISANTCVATSDPAFLDPYRRYPDAKRVLGFAFATPIAVPRARTLYLHDEESTTLEQLEGFLRREMAHVQRRSVSATYTVEGHGQITDEGFIPWTVDTTVDVDDQVANFKERMYILGRTFHKSRHGGTKTTLHLIRLNTIQLGEPTNTKPAPQVATDGEIVQQRQDLELD
jgi:prophage tail gpP-like protein